MFGPANPLAKLHLKPNKQLTTGLHEFVMGKGTEFDEPIKKPTSRNGGLNPKISTGDQIITAKSPDFLKNGLPEVSVFSAKKSSL